VNEIIETTGRAVDVAGVVVIVVGSFMSSARYGIRFVRRDNPPVAYVEARRNIGRSILFGLELLVAGDIIRSVAVAPTFTSVGVLAVIVVIRSFLSFTLELEITGRWPWQHPRATSTPDTTAPVTPAEEPDVAPPRNGPPAPA
jgi:uncharacterized membrane protein